MSDTLQYRESLPVQPPDLNKIFTLKKRECSSELNCMLVGEIVNFSPEDQTADVKINFLKIFANQPSGVSLGVSQMVDTPIQYPILSKCPVVVLNGGGGSLQFPIAVGDTCLVMFHDRDMDSWFASGTTTYPNSNRLHDFSDAIVLVGVRSLSNLIQDYVTDHVRLHHGDASLDLVDGESAALSTPDSVVAAEDKVLISVGETTLFEALNNLCDALKSATTTDSQSFSPATIEAINTAQAAIGAILK